jgi:hypothetical protein
MKTEMKGNYGRRKKDLRSNYKQRESLQKNWKNLIKQKKKSKEFKEK